MKRIVCIHVIFIFCSTLLFFKKASSQAVPQGFSYQTTVRNSSGAIIANQSVSLRYSLYSNSPSGTLVWQEDHFVGTDLYGHIKVVIGTGSSTGAGSVSSFNQISWSNGIYYLKVSLDALGSTAFIDMGTTQLFSVPYSLYSIKTFKTNGLKLGDLSDVNVSTNVVNNLLKWNGTFWIPSVDNDSDSVLYAYNSGHSTFSDSASYVFASLLSDTTLFSYQSDSSIYSNATLNSISSSTSTYADTALYVFSSAPIAWQLIGDAIGTSIKFIGTNDSSDITFRTNNLNVSTLKNDGHFAIGSTTNNASFSLNSIDGFLSSGLLASSFSPVSGAGTKLFWYPSLGAFRVGAIDSNQWDTVNLGKYSNAVGFNNKARNWSFSSGSYNESIDCSITIGRNNKALGAGVYPEGGCVALGDSNTAAYRRTVVLGKNSLASGSASIAIGFNNNSLGTTSISIGSYCTATGTRSVAIGYHASSLFMGSFVFADGSSSATVSSNVNYQFKIRASGGVVFYTDSLNTIGVTLSPGSGSWAVVSDKNKKENFSSINYEMILSNIDKLKIKSWNYKAQSKSIRHIGPMAQEFYALFNVGENNVSIATSDMDGVILAGIKGLSNRLTTLQTINEVDLIKTKIEKIDDFKSLNERIDAIEAANSK